MNIETSGAAALKPTCAGHGAGGGVICLRPSPPALTLPSIDPANVLVADKSMAAPQEIVSGLLHAGTKGVLASSSKAGKTWLLLGLAISVATGTPFLKWVTNIGKVLFINFEIHRAFIKQRLSDRKSVV